MRIGIDIDGVINNLEGYYKELGAKFCYENNINTAIRPNEYKARNIFSWSRQTEVSFYKKYYSILILTDKFLRAYADEAIQRLHTNNEIFIITSRIEADVPPGINLTMKDITEQWLIKYNIPFDSLIFSPKNKLPVICELNLDWMIEDNPEFFHNLPSISTKFICFDTSYNKDIQNKQITRAYSWYNVLQIIEASDAKCGNNMQ